MKKVSIVFTLLVSLFMTSCITSALKDLTKVTDEATEIAEGKCFTVKTGTITYEDGTIVTFKEYGKTWASATETERIVVLEGTYYVVDVENKTYSESYYGDSYSGCPYIFWENAYELGDDWGTGNLKKSTETIAGKKCTVFTADDGSKIGGWERVIFLETDSEGGTIYLAKEWNASANEELLSLEGYTLVEY